MAQEPVTAGASGEPEAGAIGVRDLRVYAERSGAAILDSVTFRLEPGARVALMGASGSGKSTLVHAIAGLVPCEAQWVHFPEPIGVVFQDPQIGFTTGSVEDEVRFALECRGVSGVAATRRVDDVLASLGLGDLRRCEPDRLSGGEQQRLQIAAVMAACPRTFLLDEPTTHLDPSAAAAVEATLGCLMPELEIVVRITHDPAQALAASRLIVLRGGRMAADGDPAQVFRTPGAEGWGIALPEPLRAAVALGQRAAVHGPLPVTWEELSAIWPSARGPDHEIACRA